MYDFEIEVNDFLTIRIRKIDDWGNGEEVRKEIEIIEKAVGNNSRLMTFNNLKEFFGFRKGFKSITIKEEKQQSQ